MITPNLRTAYRLAVIGTIVSAMTPVRADMSAQQALERCRKAYGSLHSYHCASRVVVTNTGGGADSTYSSTATIDFERPGKLRVSGTSIVSAQYGYISDGATTWQTVVSKPGIWVRSINLESAIAMAAGVSRNAGSTIPYILTGSKLNDPLAGSATGTAGRDTISGRAVLVVKTKDKYEDTTYWIDAKTFLLAQVLQHSELKKGSKSLARTIVLDVKQTLSNIQVDKPISPATFTKPAGAPL